MTRYFLLRPDTLETLAAFQAFKSDQAQGQLHTQKQGTRPGQSSMKSNSSNSKTKKPTKTLLFAAQ